LINVIVLFHTNNLLPVIYIGKFAFLIYLFTFTQINVKHMNDKDFQKLMDLADKELKKKVTKEEALRSFVSAGILDTEGNFTKPYEHLTTLIPQ